MAKEKSYIHHTILPSVVREANIKCSREYDHGVQCADCDFIRSVASVQNGPVSRYCRDRGRQVAISDTEAKAS